MSVRSHSELLPQVRDCLWRTWDPIGVNCFPEATDEYDSYAPSITAMLLDGIDGYRLAAHLRQIELVSMGLPGTHSTTDAAVTQLLRLVGR